MKKLHSFIACTLVACTSLFVFSSCEGDAGGLAPKSIVGKTCNTFNGDGGYYFETSSTFSFVNNYWTDDPKFVPKNYSYRKTSADTGELTIEYTVQFADLTGYDILLVYLLNFTTTETGWYVDNEGKHNFTLR